MTVGFALVVLAIVGLALVEARLDIRQLNTDTTYYLYEIEPQKIRGKCRLTFWSDL